MLLSERESSSLQFFQVQYWADKVHTVADKEMADLNRTQ